MDIGLCYFGVGNDDAAGSDSDISRSATGRDVSSLNLHFRLQHNKFRDFRTGGRQVRWFMIRDGEW